jgi:hypothetical protein
MTRKFAAAATFAVSFAFTGAVLRADDALPKADTILDRYVEVTGGKAAYAKRTSEVSTGTFELTAMGLKGTMTRYAAAPDKTYFVVELEGIGKIEQGTSDGIAWDNNPMTGPHVKTGVEKAEALREAAFNRDVDWRKQYQKTETVGVETVDGEECYKLVLTPKEGKPEITYYSKKTGLAIKMIATPQSPMGEVQQEMKVSAYKDFGGILMPTKMTQKAAEQEFTITIDSVKVNEAIAPDKFEIPAEVKKALAPKPAQ